jgi:outer membrane protein assembly factor BamB
MKKSALSLVALIYVLCATLTHAQVTPEQARNFQINATHTGSVSSEHVVPPLRQKWSVNFGRPLSYPLIADGRVFVIVPSSISQGTNLYALNATNGATIWADALGGIRPWSAACYENGRVFAVNSDGVLRAMDAATGTFIWNVQLPGQSSFAAPPTVVQGVIYISGAGSSGTVYAVSAASGAVLWTSNVWNGDNSSPAVTSDGVYVSYSCPNVYKLNPANGAKIWWYAPGCSGGGGKTPALYNGRLYVRDFQDRVFDSQTGTILSNFNAKNTPAFSGNLGFFLNGPHSYGSSGILEAHDVNTSALVWSFSGDGFLQSAVLVVNNYVFVGSSQGRLYAVDANTGQQVWMANTGSSIPYVDEQNVSQPLTSFAAAEGLLVIPTSTTLIAYEGADWTAPTVTWGAKTPAANAAGWNNTAVDLPYSAADDLSGVQSATPGSPLHFTSEGSNQTQQVTATDKAGNSAQFTSPVVNIDLNAPTTQAIVSGLSNDELEWHAFPVNVTLNAADNLSGVANTSYRLDGGATQTYSAPFQLSSDGEHTLEYWSADVAGNAETHHTRMVRIDTTSPVTSATVSGTAGTNGWYTGAVDVFLSASDSGSGVSSTYFQLDGGAQQTYSNPISISANGQHSVEYWSADMAGNLEAHHTQLVKLDATAPATTTTVTGTSGTNGWYVSAAQVSLTASDSDSGVQNSYYQIDGGAVQSYASPFSISANGQHTVQYWSVDSAGNTEAHQSLTLTIDTSAPVSSSAVSATAGSNGWYLSAVQISLSAADNSSGVENSYYQVDGGAVLTYAGPFSISASGVHTVAFWSVDTAGNTEAQQTRTVKIDTAAPVSSSAVSGTAGSNGWYTTAVQVSLSASDNSSGVQASYYKVDGGAVLTYATPFSISANGQHTIEFWSADVAGNTEAHQTSTLKIDSTAPVTNAAVSGTTGPGGWYSSAAQVSLSATDTPAGVQASYYKVDAGAVQTYAGPFTVSANGQHTIQYWSVDAASNTEGAHSLVVGIDNVAPVVSATANPSSANKNPHPVNVTISGNGTDTISGVFSASYSVIDEYGVTQPSGPVTLQGNGNYSFTLSLPATKNGSDKDGHLYTIVVQAKDRAGNSTSVTTTFRVN